MRSITTLLIIFGIIAVLCDSCLDRCPAFYYGDGCFPFSQRFLGAYAGGNTIVSDGHSNPASPDTPLITAGTGPDTILIGALGSGIKAAINSDGYSLAIPPQTVTYYSVPLQLLSGTGKLSGDTLTIDIDANDAGLPFTLSFTGIKE